ncbi:MAG: hypothetical protein EA392_01065 [Cryomorphaceae bacterium]|nr:MAG: hypothetical protein EA392_01065 [Cryomorphaceae bacterium]
MITKRALLFLTMAFAIASCNINKDLMFKTPIGYDYDVPPEVIDLEYKIQPFDLLNFRLYSNDGFLLIDLTSGSGAVGGGQQNQMMMRNMQNIIRYRVEVTGDVKLPTIGLTKLAGMTVRDAEFYLEDLYSEYYVRPYAMLEITNNRVIVMPGSGGDARVITLTNNNMTVTEALAQAGGVAKRGNASKIKLIRNSPEGRKVYLINLAKIDGVADGDIIVQANDIIYVEPVPQYVAEALRDVTPLVGLLTTFLVLINIVR